MAKTKDEAIKLLQKGIEIANSIHNKTGSCEDKNNHELFYFKEQQYSRTTATKRRESAVLILLRYDISVEGCWEVLLTLRPRHMRFHPGLTCLPGGKMEQGEDVISCALRETNEEVGISKQAVNVVGILPPSVTIGNITVVPVIAVLKDDQQVPQLTLNSNEVDDVFWMPLINFLRREDHRSIKMELIGGISIDGHYFDYLYPQNGHMYTVWGLTSRILVLFSCLAFHRLPEYVSDNATEKVNLDQLYIGYIPSMVLTSKL